MVDITAFSPKADVQEHGWIDTVASAPARSRSGSRSPCLASESIRKAIISFTGSGADVTDGPASLEVGLVYDFDRLRIEAGHSKQL